MEKFTMYHVYHIDKKHRKYGKRICVTKSYSYAKKVMNKSIYNYIKEVLGVRY